MKTNNNYNHEDTSRKARKKKLTIMPDNVTNKLYMNQFKSAYYILLKELEQADYYGEVILKFEKGQIVHMKKTESIKLK